ncbi:hypothetical protein HK405_001211, partial [Cladochytrium tenue]
TWPTTDLRRRHLAFLESNLAATDVDSLREYLRMQIKAARPAAHAAEQSWIGMYLDWAREELAADAAPAANTKGRKAKRTRLEAGGVSVAAAAARAKKILDDGLARFPSAGALWAERLRLACGLAADDVDGSSQARDVEKGTSQFERAATSGRVPEAEPDEEIENLFAQALRQVRPRSGVSAFPGGQETTVQTAVRTTSEDGGVSAADAADDRLRAWRVYLRHVSRSGTDGTSAGGPARDLVERRFKEALTPAEMGAREPHETEVAGMYLDWVWRTTYGSVGGSGGSGGAAAAAIERVRAAYDHLLGLRPRSAAFLGMCVEFERRELRRVGGVHPGGGSSGTGTTSDSEGGEAEATSAQADARRRAAVARVRRLLQARCDTDAKSV